MKRSHTLIALAIVSAVAAGCETPRQNQTAVGTGAGAVTGAAIGAAVGGGRGAAVGAGIGGGIGAAVGYNWDAVKDKLGIATKGSGLDVSEQADGSLKVNVPGSVSFPSGSAALSPSLYGTLDRIAATLNEYPKTSVTVVGYTDSVGSTESNRDLSRRRATAVAQYLGQHGVAADRIIVQSRGEENPVASNDSDSGRAQNRRVEMLVRPMQS